LPINFLKVNRFIADIDNRGKPMNESEIQIGRSISHSTHPITKSKETGHSSSDSQIHDKVLEKETSSGYVIENNRIVYEKYDQQGKLILKVPWNGKPFEATA
jgi:hypothetical protein